MANTISKNLNTATPEKPPKKVSIVEKKTVTITGVSISSCYCRKCMKTKRVDEFSNAVDLFLDSNGKMSVCKDCCNETYERFFKSKGEIMPALYETCKALNVEYNEEVCKSTEKHVETQAEHGSCINKFFTLYMAKLCNVQNTPIGQRVVEDRTFTDTAIPIYENNKEEIPNDYQDYLENFWGKGFSFEDYKYLENELAEWKKTHKSDTKAEEMLLQELSYKGLEIRKAREANKVTGRLIKELQDIMKTASVDPAKAAIAGSGKTLDTFSSFIRTIEENEPADYYKDKGLFRDFDNIGFYFKKYVTRPLKNFITGSRDFDIGSPDSEDNDEEETLDVSDIPTTIPE